jgi:acyl-CoA thioesterase FadM
MHIDPEHREQWSDMWTPKAIGMILGSIRTDYKFPMVWPDKVSVFHKLSTVPTSDTSAFTLDVMILSEKEQRPAARCVESIVMYDYRIGKKTTFPPFMLEAFKNLWKEQKTAQEKNTAKLLSLFAEVRALEKDSWDKADVVEDFGNVKRKNRASAG